MGIDHKGREGGWAWSKLYVHGEGRRYRHIHAKLNQEIFVAENALRTIQVKQRIRMDTRI